MKTYKLNDFTRGWLIGDFEPNILRSKDAEFMVRYYKKGDKEARHIHKKTHEITVIVTGRFKMNGHELVPGDIIHLEPGIPADFECLEDGANAVFKSPSAIKDKYLI
jgi:quercetin dioxygenase-like cupin family protein